MLVTACMAGWGPLSELLHGGQQAAQPLEWLSKLSLARQVCSTVQSLHHQPPPVGPVVLCNLNSCNIMVKDAGTGGRRKVRRSPDVSAHAERRCKVCTLGNTEHSARLVSKQA
jgi:hypothetical protein